MGKHSRRSRGLSSVLLGILLTGSMCHAGLFDTWNYKMPITLSGYSGSSTLTNFPVLVILNTSMAGSGYSEFASANGNDLRFSTADGATELKYDIDTWNNNGNSYIWVQVPTIASSTNSIWAYWGNSGSAGSRAAYTTNGSAWESRFTGVYHLNENLANGGTTGVNSDSTAAHADGTQHFTGYIAGGVVGGGQESDHASGQDDYIRLPGSVITVSAYTKELWYWYDGANAGALFNGDSGKTTLGITIGGNHALSGGNFDPPPVIDATAFPSQSWQHCAITYDSSVSGGTMKLYRNGTQVAVATAQSPTTALTDAYVFSTGGGWNCGGRGDEMRLSSTARSADWVLASYQTAGANGSFETYGAVQGSGGTNPPSGATNWVAYDDAAWVSGETTTSITTNSPAGIMSGALKNYSGGATLSAQVTFNNGSATPTINTQVLTPVPNGSDAYNEFNGAVGLDGFCNWQVSPITMTFSALDSTKRYDVVVYSTRGFESSAYSNRYTDIAISSVGVFTNSSSSGATIFTTSTANDSARIIAGNVDGKVFKFRGIDPGVDGNIVFTLTPGGMNGQGTNGYINAFKIQESGGTNSSGGSTNSGSSGGSGEDTTRYFKGTQEASSPIGDWRNRVFTNAAGWLAGNQPFGFGSAVTYGTALNDMSNSYQSLFVRAPFVVTNAASVASIDLTVDFDDGFEGWINGTQVAQSNQPASIVYNTGGMPGRDSFAASGGSSPLYTINLTSLGSLVTGTNILALQGWNTAIANHDFYLGYTITVNYQSGGGNTNSGGGGTSTAQGALSRMIEINEWMPFNRTFTTDPADGAYDGWIELFNNTSSNIDLTGWRLTDDLSNSNKYVIVSGKSIAAKSRRMVWADNQTSQNSANSDIHAGFVLSTRGGVIGLFDPTGLLVDAVGYDIVNSDKSDGRTVNGNVCDTRYPTPGAADTILQATNFVMVPNSNQLTFSYSVQDKHTYRMKYANSLLTPNWSQYSDMVATGTALTLTVPMSGSTNVRNYKMVDVTSRNSYIGNTNDTNVRNALSSGANLIQTATLSDTIGSDANNLQGLRNGYLDYDHGTYGWSSSTWDGSRVRATWGSPQTIDRVWLFGAGSIYSGTEHGRIWLSDGTEYDFGVVPDRMIVPGVEVSFAPRSITWVEVELVQTRGAGIGEMAIFNGEPAGVTNIEWFTPRTSWLYPTPPAGCTFPQSSSITGLTFTGKHIEYEQADTWYPTWGSDGYMYGPFADGTTEGQGVTCYGNGSPNQTTTTGNVKIKGDDPMDLQITALNMSSANTGPHYEARYPCGSLMVNGVWYYGTYVCNSNNTDYTDTTGVLHKVNWTYCGALTGFRYSTDNGQSWTDGSPYPRGASGCEGLFPEPTSYNGDIKFGTPHFVDFGQNMQYSPDGKAYLVGHGTMSGQTNREIGNVSWITGDGVFLSRVTPSIANINDSTKWEFFAGLSGTNATWSSSLSAAQPIAWWDNHMGCVTVTYNPGLHKYLMCVVDGRWTHEDMDTYILESDTVYGPWKRVQYMGAYGGMGYFVNIPSKFISADGKTMWLSFSANFLGAPNWYNYKFDQPEGSRYAWCLQEVKLLP